MIDKKVLEKVLEDNEKVQSQINKINRIVNHILRKDLKKSNNEQVDAVIDMVLQDAITINEARRLLDIHFETGTDCLQLIQESFKEKKSNLII